MGLLFFLLHFAMQLSTTLSAFIFQLAASRQQAVSIDTGRQHSYLGVPVYLALQFDEKNYARRMVRDAHV